MSKDRAAPFSRKHKRYWITVLGGMILIGLVNVIIGTITYMRQPEQGPPEKIELVLPPPSVGSVDNSYRTPAPVDAGTASVPADVKR